MKLELTDEDVRNLERVVALLNAGRVRPARQTSPIEPFTSKWQRRETASFLEQILKRLKAQPVRTRFNVKAMRAFRVQRVRSQIPLQTILNSQKSATALRLWRLRAPMGTKRFVRLLAEGQKPPGLNAGSERVFRLESANTLLRECVVVPQLEFSADGIPKIRYEPFLRPDLGHKIGRWYARRTAAIQVLVYLASRGLQYRVVRCQECGRWSHGRPNRKHCKGGACKRKHDKKSGG